MEHTVALLLQEEEVQGKSGNWGREGRQEYDQAVITAQLYSFLRLQCMGGGAIKCL